MRNIKTRRRFRITLEFLLALAIVLFVESRIEALVPQIKGLAEFRLKTAFRNKADLSIGNIEGGVFKPLIFNDISIKAQKGSVVFSSVDISSIRTNYRIWDAVFYTLREFMPGKNEERSSLMSGLISKDSPIDIKFAAKNRELWGFVRIEGDQVNSTIKGYINFSESEKLDFSGMVKQNFFDIEIRPRAGFLRVAGTVSEDGALEVNLKAEHLKLYGYDIVCEAELNNRIGNTPGRQNGAFMEGELVTKNFILNYRPFLNAKASYKISDGVIDISELKLGDSFKVSGRMGLKKPYNMDIRLSANNVSLSWLMLSLGAKDGTSIISGTLNGRFDFKGPAKKLKVISRMEIKNGTLSVLDFESLSANLSGELPFLRIDDSRIIRQSGYFALAGEMDLRKTGKASLFQDIRMVSDDKAVTWDEWTATKTQGLESVNMTKRINEDLNLDFKKIIMDDKIDESVRDTDEIGIEYKLHPHDSLKMTIGQDKDFLGLEHKDRF